MPRTALARNPSLSTSRPAGRSVAHRGALPAAAARPDKRDLILRAAVRVFAERGFFGAQVADVARVAGVAAGTVYLYFHGKDDLLVSIFERVMTDAIAEARVVVSTTVDPVDRLRQIARLHLDRLGRDRNLAVVFQVELRQSTKFMEQFSTTRLREYLGLIRDAIGDGQAAGRGESRGRSDLRGESALRRARRDGDQLDAQPAADVARRRRGSGRRSVRERGGPMIRTAAVLGAGTMGAQIAAHLANAGVPVALLDVSRDAAADGLKRARALRPDPFFTPEAATRITTGGFEEDLAHACRAEWIVEAIVERLDLKQQLFARVESHRAAGSIVSSNTSGIPVAALADGRGEAFRRHFLGTHFFNPPRYLRLLELIPTADTAGDVRDRVAAFADLRLGKGVVVAKDTPNFIANHLGLYGVLRIFDALATGDYTIEEIDAMTGPALGRPRSATFRTLDITGLDILVHVAGNLAERVPPEQARAFAVPPLAAELVSRGWIGEKAGRGFYERVKGAGGIRDSHPRPGDVVLPHAPAGALSVDRAGEEHRRERRADPHAVSRR